MPRREVRASIAGSWYTLSPAKFRLTCITPDVGDIRRRAFDELRALGMEDEARQSYGTPESRDIDFSASADAECGSERALLEGGSTMSANSMKSTCPLPNPEEQP